jgi:chromosome segregation ATPase
VNVVEMESSRQGKLSATVTFLVGVREELGNGDRGIMEHEELSRLEKIVEKLLSQFLDLKQENKRLEADLKELKLETSDLRESALRLKEEKNMVHQRVISLISSLERWEAGQQDRLSPPANNTEKPEQQDLHYPKSAAGFGVEA